MRLDHLLSREPCCGAALAVGPRRPPCAGGGGAVAWCLGARGFRWQCAGGARPRCGVGHGGFAAVGKRARCRVHVQHPWPPPLGGASSSLGGGCGPLLGGRPASCFGGGCVGFGPSAGILPSLGGGVVVVVGCL